MDTRNNGMPTPDLGPVVPIELPPEHFFTPDTPRMYEVPLAVLQQEAKTERAIRSDQIARRRLRFPDAITKSGKNIIIACSIVLLVGVSAIIGAYTKELTERTVNNAELARSLRTAIPVVRAVEVDVDPGQYAGKLVDVVLTVTKGGMFKSGKGLYMSERDNGFTLVIFQSAFASFNEENPANIVAHYIGKYVKARGIIRRFQGPTSQSGEARYSMTISAPGLLSEIPEK